MDRAWLPAGRGCCCCWLVGFGIDVFSAFERLGLIADGEDYLAWGSAATGRGETVPVFWLYHPAGAYWSASHDALLRHMR